MEEDTICAISTPSGVGAIAIIRVSGKEAIKITNRIFSCKINSTENHIIKYGYIKDKSEIIDEVLVMVMRAPKTYTLEDIVEINCHGGYATTSKILELLLNHGCRLANPGEFTKRAFLNGRINLLESEAVNDLIKAKTDAYRKLSINNIGGKLTQIINDIRKNILELLANIEVNIDYPEYYDNTVVTNKLLSEQINLVTKSINTLVQESKYGQIIANGIKVAIVGKPNVGKSSLFNHLLDEEKAIVTDIAGTTRDLLEGVITLNGIELRLIDTAGIRLTSNLVEKIGVDKSEKSIKNADVIILVIDGSAAMNSDDLKIMNMVDKSKTIVFINKNDKPLVVEDQNINFSRCVYGNTVSSNGLDNLKKELIDMLHLTEINDNLSYLYKPRQISLAQKASKSLNNAKVSLEKNMPIDLIAIDLKSCYEDLGELIGENYNNDIIDKLFEDFCVGK